MQKVNYVITLMTISALQSYYYGASSMEFLSFPDHILLSFYLMVFCMPSFQQFVSYLA